MTQTPTDPAVLQAAKQAMLEKRLQALRNSSQAGPRIPRVSREAPVPLSFAQESLWFLDQLQPGNPAYNLFDRWRLRGLLDVEALERAFNEVVRRHEVLRSNFPAVLVTQITSRVRQVFDVELSMRHLFGAPTVAGLAQIVEERLEEQLRAMSQEELEHLAAGRTQEVA